MEDEKSYDPGDRTLKFFNRQDDITLDDIPETLRAEMSFGYAAIPKSLSKLFKNLKQLKGPGPHSDQRLQLKGPGPHSDQRLQLKGPGPHSDQRLHLLQNCPTVALPQVHGVTACPSMRACPTCGALLEHDMTACKNLLCPRCEKEFCFVCLKLKSECMKTSSPYKACSAGVARRQTSIPTWSGN